MSFRVFALFLGLSALLASLTVPLFAQTDDDSEPAVRLAAHEGTGPRVVDSTAAPSDAEKIARLQRSIEADETRLRELNDSLNDPASDYSRSEEEFKKLDAELATAKRDLAEAQDDSQPPPVLQPLEARLADINGRWAVARELFQLEIEDRKTKQASIANLETKIRKDREALAKLKGGEPARPLEEAPVTPTTTAPTATPELQSPTQPAAPLLPKAGLLPSTPPSGEKNDAPARLAPLELPRGLLTPPRDDKAVAAAAKTAEKKAEKAQDAEREAQSITERVDILRHEIELQRRMKEVGRKKVDAAEDALRSLNEMLNRKFTDGESVEEVSAQLCEAQDRLRAAKIESRGYSSRLDELHEELDDLHEQQLAALRQAERARQEAEAAQQAVDELNNPFTTRNMGLWFAQHGVVVLLVVISVLGVLYASGSTENRLVQFVAGRSRRGSREERENRARTIVTVLQNVARILAVSIGTIMVLEEFGVPIGPLLGGAAVIGLAVAFGAQSLIKDYFTGFMVLTEQQYMINDVIKVGEIVGQVERITLRMTVLRDMEGRVHFLPHGEIHTVTNLTHGWSRAVLEVSVAYKERVDHVIAVLKDLAEQLRHDAHYGLMILDEPQMLGVDSLADSGVTIKFWLKTRPLRQWEIKRELLRRIKNRFDELGIEIPFPHRTLYLRTDSDSVSQAAAHFSQGKAA
jgi:moderate conductance mechanosensitive channel